MGPTLIPLGIRRAAKASLYKDENLWIDLLATKIYANRRSERRYVLASRMQAKSRTLRHELQTIVAVCSLIDNSTMFVDCGANVGLWSATVAKLGFIYPDLKVLAFEPNPSTFSRLLELKTIFDNIEFNNVALSDRQSVVEMQEGAGSGDFGIRRSGLRTSGKVIAVKACPLDRFAMQDRNMIIKIDVEGHELEVLNVMKELLEQRKVKAILLDDFDRTKEEEIINILHEADFELINANSLKMFVRGDYALLALHRTTFPEIARR